jgi:putative ribosome biogenesis GTPase RsgA
MKCSYRKKIESYHDGLLDQKVQVAISNHLETCTLCQQYLSELESDDHRLARLKSFKPELANPDAFRNKILRKIKPRTRNVFRNEMMRMIDGIIIMLVQPATRYTFITAAIVFFGLFVYQQSSIVQKIDTLEKRLESKIQNEDAKSTNRKNIEAFFKRDVEEKQQSKDFDELLQDYSQLKIRYKLLIKILQERYPETYKELVKEMDEELILFPDINI